MTQIHLTFRPEWEGGTTLQAHLGALLIGRIMEPHPGQAQWTSFLPRPSGLNDIWWRKVDGIDQAKADLTDHVRDWLRQGGLLE